MSLPYGSLKPMAYTPPRTPPPSGSGLQPDFRHRRRKDNSMGYAPTKVTMALTAEHLVIGLHKLADCMGVPNTIGLDGKTRRAPLICGYCRSGKWLPGECENCGANFTEPWKTPKQEPDCWKPTVILTYPKSLTQSMFETVREAWRLITA